MIVRDPKIQHGDLLATTNLVYAPEGSPVEIIPDGFHLTPEMLAFILKVKASTETTIPKHP